MDCHRDRVALDDRLVGALAERGDVVPRVVDERRVERGFQTPLALTASSSGNCDLLPTRFMPKPTLTMLGR